MSSPTRMADANPVRTGRHGVSRRSLYRHWEMWAAHILVFICAFACVLVVSFLLGHAGLASSHVWRTRSAVIVGGGIGCGVSGYLFFRIRRYVLRRYFAKTNKI